MALIWPFFSVMSRDFTEKKGQIRRGWAKISIFEKNEKIALRCTKKHISFMESMSSAFLKHNLDFLRKQNFHQNFLMSWDIRIFRPKILMSQDIRKIRRKFLMSQDIRKITKKSSKEWILGGRFFLVVLFLVFLFSENLRIFSEK